MAKITVKSKFSLGQKVWFLLDSKIITGEVIGFEGNALKNYNSKNRIEVSHGNRDYDMVNEDSAFTSERALLIHIKNK